MVLKIDLDLFPSPEQPYNENGPKRIILGGGCFWCTEAVFLQLEGVTSVVSGYAGGNAATANYEAVCSGMSGHAEVIEINYNSDVINLSEILTVFFSIAHDPTQLNRQGNDTGTQYRSAIFYEDENQKAYVQNYINELNSKGVFSAPIVTTLETLSAFYKAEDYHQDFANRNPMQPYVQFSAIPKVEKLKQAMPDKLKR